MKTVLTEYLDTKDDELRVQLLETADYHIKEFSLLLEITALRKESLK